MLNRVFAIAFVLGAGAGLLVGCESSVTTDRSSNPEASEGIRAPERPDALVGTWQWQWRQGTTHHIVLDASGRAAKVEGRDQFHRNGTWRVRDDGVLEVTFKMEFRIDNGAEAIERSGHIEIMDLETVPSERDFQWVRIDTRTDLSSMPTELGRRQR